MLLILGVPDYFTDVLWWSGALTWPIVATITGLVLLTVDLWWPEVRARLPGPRDPLERALLDALHDGERLRKRLCSGDPPTYDKVGEWAGAVVEHLRKHGEDALTDRFYGNDGVRAPFDAAAHADYMLRRLRELRAILRSVRGRG